MNFQQSPTNSNQVQQQANSVTKGIGIGCGVFGASILLVIPVISALIAVIVSALTGQKNNPITGMGVYLLFFTYLLTPAVIMGAFYLWFRKKNSAFTKSFLWTSVTLFVIYFLMLLMMWSFFSKFGGSAEVTSGY